MSKKTREELIAERNVLIPLKEEEKAFYNLPHEQKADVNTFTRFSEAHSGTLAILLSDNEICDNKELVLIAAKNGFWSGFHLLSERLLDDPDIALALVHCNRNEYTNVSKRLRNDVELMSKALSIDTGIYGSLPVKVRVDDTIVKKIAALDPYELRHLLKVKKEYRDSILGNKEIALIVAKKDLHWLHEYFYESLFNDNEILEAAFHISDKNKCIRILKNEVWALQYINPNIWIDDLGLIKMALRDYGELYRLLPLEYQRKKDLALLSIKSCPYVIKYFPDEFKDDEEIARKALQPETNEILSFLSDRLKDDYNIVYHAVTVDALNLQFASDRLRDNRDIVLKALKSYGGVLEDASERLQKDEELIKISRKNM